MKTKIPGDLPQIDDRPIGADSIKTLWEMFRLIKEWSYGYKKIHGKVPESAKLWTHFKIVS